MSDQDQGVVKKGVPLETAFVPNRPDQPEIAFTIEDFFGDVTRTADMHRGFDIGIVLTKPADNFGKKIGPGDGAGADEQIANELTAILDDRLQGFLLQPKYSGGIAVQKLAYRRWPRIPAETIDQFVAKFFFEGADMVAYSWL